MKVHSTGSTAQVLDFLETFDGAWYTARNLADLLPVPEPNLRRTLLRLAEAGLVQTRSTEAPTDWGPYTERSGSTPQGWRRVNQYRVPDRRWLDRVYG